MGRRDPVSDVLIDDARFQRKREEAARLEQEQKEALIAESNQIIGRIQGASVISKFSDVSVLVWLKDVKERKLYKSFGSWENYCKYCGLSYQHVDEGLQNLSVLGEDLLLTVRTFSLSYRDLRKLRKQIGDGSIVIGSEAIEIAGEKIPLDADHTEDLHAAIDSLLDAKDKVIAEKDKIIKTKDRILAQKDELIGKQVGEISDLEKTIEAKEKSLFPGEEEEFLRRAEDWRVGIHGFAGQFDPEINPLPEDATPRMKAAIVSAAGYWARVFIALYHSLAECYGEREIDGFDAPYLESIGGGAAEGDDGMEMGAGPQA